MKKQKELRGYSNKISKLNHSNFRKFFFNFVLFVSNMMKGSKVLFAMYYDNKILELISRDTGERVNRVIYIVHKVQTSMQKVG